MALSVQDQISDALIRHRVGVERAAGGIRNLITKVLDDSEPSLRRRIFDRLRKHSGGFSIANEMRVRALFADVRRIRGAAFRRMWPVWRDELAKMAAQEPAIMEGILRTTSPTRLGRMRLPDDRSMRALVTRRPFQGRVLRQWATNLRATDVRAIQDQIRIGLAQGETIQQITGRVVGNRAFSGRNGITALTRKHAETITKTAAAHYTNTARRAFFEENPDLVKFEAFVAELDRRTTETCFSLHGKVKPVGQLPVPPLHFRCRSNLTAAVNPKGRMSDPRRMKDQTEKLMLREFSRKHGLGSVLDRASLPRGFKGQFDAFSRSEMQRLIGPRPKLVSGDEWLRRQSNAFLRDTLGPTRARLLRAGMGTRQMIRRLGERPIPLRDLGRMNAEQFRAAGLDPEDFFF